MINPTIAGLERARKITLLCLVSGGFDTNFRDRINVLFLGEPGTGKTSIRDFVINKIGEYLDSPYLGTGSGAKRAGLTYNANRDKIGVLNKANNGVLAVDELDEILKEDRGSLLEAMSEGKYEVAKGKYTNGKKFEANVRLIGTANDESNFRPEFLDRWDFIIKFQKPTSKTEFKIVEKTFNKAYSNTDNKARELAKYIENVRSYKPIPKDMDENVRLTSNLIKVLKKKVSNETEYKKKYSDVRQKQSLLRTALAIARLERSKQNKKHFIRSIRLHYPELSDKELKDIKTS